VTEARCPKCNDVLETMELPDDIRVLACPSCLGAFYDAGELMVPLQLENPMHSSYACPSCGGRFSTGTIMDGKLTLEQCAECGGWWFDKGEIQKLRELSGVEGVIGHPHKKDAPLIAPAAMAALGSVIAASGAESGAAKADPEPRPARRLQPQTPTSPLDAPLRRGTGNAFDAIPEGTRQSNPDERNCPTVEVDGLVYEHYQTSWPTVTNVLGEFYWKVQVGDKGVARDFVSPPYIVSEDLSAGDSSWSQGEYIQPEEVWAAFNLEGSPPTPKGTAPNQPNPYMPAVKTGWLVAIAACALSIFVYSVLHEQTRTIFERSFQYAKTDPEKSRVTEIFELGPRQANVEVELGTNLQNQWADFDVALINADTDEALDLGKEVGYYEGRDSDGAWYEGSRGETLYVPAVPAGRYYLRIEPETPSETLNYAVKIVWGRPSLEYLLAGLALIAGPFLLLCIFSSGFETGRWAESDHPRVTTSDDDDD
jgi:Zn-finger nucleic acid-binding protein